MQKRPLRPRCPRQQALPVVTENLVCMLTLSAGETDQDTGVAAMQGVLDLKAGSAEKNPAWLATKLLWFIRRTEAIVSEDRLMLSGMALVSVMRSSDLRNHYDAPAFWLLHGPRFRSIFGQRQMSSGVVVVGKITSQSPRNDLSFHTMTWSKHSRRMEPISRSTYGFCHGERGAVVTSSIPMPFVMATQSPP